jgi:MFS family permease
MENHGRAAFAVAIVAVVVSLLALAGLHFLSPEHDPSWRMISEYANGRYSWVLSVMFLSWAVGSWALAYALRNDLRKWWGKLGFALLVLSGIGEAMAVAFDVNHSLHGLAFLFGVGGFLAASTVIGIRLATANDWRSARGPLLGATFLVWVGAAVMAITMAAFLGSVQKAGVELGPGKPPLAALPRGVTAYNGWANRFLVLVFELWLLTVAVVGRAVHRDTMRPTGKA